ncbi:Superinfection exclusion protein B [Mucilaginibacter mallensis]|uniref:Superinfection exclusion protein B n=1 Tax=Mucilaginibacter mallensis TaxID=652787 RepID=A0A1H2BD61_MUCMA|nr:super-infection exclusion protein B [Mucilaginibacter mallensis]SDT55972.1 Superinfection exclusion protein B [Mucilaginibacter mallensis]
MKFLSDLLDLNKITAKTAFLVLIVSVCLLFLPPAFLLKLQIVDFKKDYGKYFGFAFLASAAFLLVAVLNWAQEKINVFFRKRKQATYIIKAIEKMDFQELAVLREFFINAQQSLDMPIDNPVVAGMLNKGLLYQLSSMGQMSAEGLMMPVAMHHLLKDNLKPESLGLPLTEPSQEVKNEILEARPNWAKSLARRKFNSWY